MSPTSSPPSVSPSPSSSREPDHARKDASAASSEPDSERFFGLSTAQVTGSALAAGTSAYAASHLGVAGTLIGALVGSIIATVAAAVYSHSLRRAGQHLKVLRPGQQPPSDQVGRSTPTGTTRPVSAGAGVNRTVRRRTWPRVAVGVLAGAVLALAVITGVEGLLGHPLSDSAQRGTSIGEVLGRSGGPAHQPAQVDTPTPSSTTPGSLPTPTDTVAPGDQQAPVQPAGGASSEPPTAPPATPEPSQTAPDEASTAPVVPTQPGASSPADPGLAPPVG
ncbi:hypothetical protein [Intrasporangium sp.]|uniref:hypothetical protein n=1 Tax=Intrasporangium sp. TaxID=1925024 RepID=UPI003221AB76